MPLPAFNTCHDNKRGGEFHYGDAERANNDIAQRN